MSNSTSIIYLFFKASSKHARICQTLQASYTYSWKQASSIPDISIFNFIITLYTAYILVMLQSYFYIFMYLVDIDDVCFLCSVFFTAVYRLVIVLSVFLCRESCYYLFSLIVFFTAVYRLVIILSVFLYHCTYYCLFHQVGDIWLVSCFWKCFTDSETVIYEKAWYTDNFFFVKKISPWWPRSPLPSVPSWQPKWV